MTQPPAKAILEILLVDDDAELRSDTASYFSRHGHRVEQCANGEDALNLLERRGFDVMVLDLNMPGFNGLEVLKELEVRNAECEVVVLTGQATIETAVEAMKHGAREFLTKPISLKELDRLVRKAYETAQLRKENRQLKAALQYQHRPPQIIGRSEPMQEMCRLIARLGPTDKPVLIQGESGTGKELVAQRCTKPVQLPTNRWSSSIVRPCRKRSLRVSYLVTKRVHSRAQVARSRACSRWPMAAPCLSMRSANWPPRCRLSSFACWRMAHYAAWVRSKSGASMCG